MESVILFDEAQSLPQHLTVPTLAALSHLFADYRTSVLFATATQPAFEVLDDAVKKQAVKGWCPAEVVPNHPEMFATLKRVTVRWPKPSEKRSWAELANELRESEQSLVVVNLKRHALALLEAMGKEEGLYHLSTNLCTEHRRAVLETVRTQLADGKPCRLISTQCVEAGVDVDFPVVYRALGPLEAIAQAAGRCNREGRMGGLGEVVVFEPEEEGNWRRRYPTHAYYQAAEVTRTLLALHGKLDINDPKVFSDYYRRLYDLNDPSSQNTELAAALQALDFPEVARRYRLIEHDAIQVVVPWAERINDFEALSAEAERDGISADWMRRAQGLAVGIYRPNTRHPASSVLISAKLRHGGTSDEWYILEDRAREYYEETLGLMLPQSDQIFIA
jgi:CRISPR/Cas system-associated endonuclease/helicase Cas3